MIINVNYKGRLYRGLRRCITNNRKQNYRMKKEWYLGLIILNTEKVQTRTRENIIKKKVIRLFDGITENKNLIKNHKEIIYFRLQ